VKEMRLARVKYVPRDLAQDVLYVSQEYAVAVHLCACGCGNKVTTPLTPTEWIFSERNGRPTLDPSIGNWQLPCRSHYFIREGRIISAPQWSDAQIRAGREAEQGRREAYFTALSKEGGFWTRVWNSISSLWR